MSQPADITSNLWGLNIKTYIEFIFKQFEAVCSLSYEEDDCINILNDGSQGESLDRSPEAPSVLLVGGSAGEVGPEDYGVNTDRDLPAGS